jgi:hypothetical protein
MRDVSMNLGWMPVAAAVALSSFPWTAQQADTTTRAGVSANAGSGSGRRDRCGQRSGLVHYLAIGLRAKW